MSKRSQARRSARRSAVRAPGSHLTRRCRVRTCARLIRFLYKLGFQVQGLQSLRVEHIVAYIKERRRLKPNLNVRTLQNDMSDIRVSLREAGREGLADHQLISNSALGIGGGSHRGSNSSVTPEEYELILAAAGSLGLEFEIACELIRFLGLRALEVVSSGGSLKKWRKQLLLGTPVHVVRGTKGGRPRWVRPADAAKALATVERALKALRDLRRNHLFPGTLKQAIGRFNRKWSRYCRLAAGRRVTPHSLRYTFAQDIEALYISEGYSESDAKALATMSLGHGDGRGRLMNLVYGQRPPALAKTVEPNSENRAYKHVVRGPTMGAPLTRFGNPMLTATFGVSGDAAWMHPAVSFGGRGHFGCH